VAYTNPHDGWWVGAGGGEWARGEGTTAPAAYLWKTFGQPWASLNETHRGEPNREIKSDGIHCSRDSLRVGRCVTKNETGDGDDGLIVSIGFGLCFPTHSKSCNHLSILF
jgi:hypothetical protein